MKSLTRTPNPSSAAEQPVARPVVGASKVVAEGVPLSSDPHPASHPCPLLTEGEAA
ncbi:hypothetical protein ACPB9E_20745 [Streptomyces exfoliatus]|uniref:hypothetical protein n=1 Tax=Streptomyces exfoliatus TaxID=1905 RepID=UPI003C2DF61A